MKLDDVEVNVTYDVTFRGKVTRADKYWVAFVGDSGTRIAISADSDDVIMNITPVLSWPTGRNALVKFHYVDDDEVFTAWNSGSRWITEDDIILYNFADVVLMEVISPGTV